MIVSRRDTKLSRLVAHALRHRPELYGLKLDSGGWINIRSLVRALAASDSAWHDLSSDEVRAMVVTAAKQRYEIEGDRIRALYGHSFAERVERKPSAPPERLYHGTTPEALRSIRSEGLKPMRRQQVHLSSDPETAVLVAKRRSETPAIIEVLAEEAHAEGIAFYLGNDRVWLSDAIPARFLKLSED